MKIKLPKKKTIIISLAICLILCIITVFVVNAYVKHSVSDYIMEPDKISSDDGHDCILVLGCGVWDDGTPSPMLADRLRRAVELYHAGAAPKIIMSGDHGTKEYDEVNVMREYALDKGVPAEDIFMDHAGFSTYESMYRAREVFCVSDMIIVTQEYHLYRALYIAKSFGMNAIGIGSDYRAYYGQSVRDLREVAARCKDFAKCILKPKPTYLGEPIPVSGDGNATNG